MSNDRASALDGGPAFPNAGESNRGICTQPQPGMSLRDWFAGQAVMGMLANPELLEASTKMGISFGDIPDQVAKCAGRYADAMLRERSSPQATAKQERSS